MSGLLPLAVLHHLVDMAGRCGVLDTANRGFLLAALTPAFRSTLTECASPRDQALSDLMALNRHMGPPPALAGWLGAAARLTHSAEGRLTFLRAARDVADAWWALAARDAIHRVEPSRLTPGTLFDGRFELLEILSDSLFSVVWLARDTRTAQQVALKILKHLLDVRGRRRLVRGAVHLCRMGHPNLVRVFDFCAPEDETQPFYYWMEYLPGGDLYRALLERRLVGRPAIRVLLSAAEGLAASHAKGVWHRDVKPENILLGDDGRPRLADFDLLHHVGASEDTGRLASVAFAAPEALADLRLADHRADIFGLGRSLQFILFVERRADVDADELGSLWARTAMGGIEPGSLRCASELEAILTRATHVDPERRHDSVRSFIEDVRGVLDEPQTRLGRRFVLGRPIAKSDDKVVYDGIDTGALDPDGASARVVIERFGRELSSRMDASFSGGRWSEFALGLLNHPGIEPVRARGSDHQGCYWQVTDWRDGTALSDVARLRVSDSTDPFEDLSGVGRWLCDLAVAVEHAHERGIVHCGITPDNLFVVRDRCVLSGWAFANQRNDTHTTQAAERDICAVGDVIQALAAQALGLAERTGGLYLWPDACHAARLAVERSQRELMELAQSFIDGRFRAMSAGLRALEDWLAAVDGRRELAAAEEWRCEAREKRARALRIRRDARHALSRLQPWASADQKAERWAELDRASALLAEARAAHTRWFAAVHAQRSAVPDAGEHLIDELLGRLAEADGTGDAEAIARLESQLAAHSRNERVAAALQSVVPVTFSWQSPDVRVEIARYVERRRRLVPVDQAVLAPSGRATCELRRGYYRVRVTTAEGIEARWPVRIPRSGPAGGLVMELPDALLGDLTVDEAIVPAGPCTVGDDNAIDAMARQVVHLDAFAMRRRPVTHREYIAFLEWSVAYGQAGDVQRFLPRQVPTVPGAVSASIYSTRSDGTFALPAGSPFTLEHPVSGVSWFAARAYSAFEAQLTGLPWRLPRELEWEKAARGIDGRNCPWGAHVDEVFGNVVNSREGLAAPIAVDVYTQHFPDDVSPYGVEGLGGNMRTWCDERWRCGGPAVEFGAPDAVRRLAERREVEPENDTLMIIRGAAWSTSRYHMRSANRYADKAEWNPSTAGIRLVRSIGMALED